MFNFSKLFPGGIHPKEGINGKNVTKNLPIVKSTSPNKVVIPMNQHLGTPSTCIVKKGDNVLKGQVIGQSNGYVSVNIHSSVSGKVISVEKQLVSNGTYYTSVEIENDHLEQWVELQPVLDVFSLSSDEFLQKIKELGVVGLGGATFPTHVKLNPKDNIDTLIINAAECEPYLSADYRLMVERSDKIILGIKLVQQYLNIPKVVIGIEDNKLEAIDIFQDKLKTDTSITVKRLKTTYPQGGEKQLIYACTKRKVKMGELPSSIGVIVLNVSTCFSIYEAIYLGKPVVQRIVTVTGSVNEPQNLEVLIGTPIEHLLEICKGLKKETKTVISGGPMMGSALTSLGTPITKGSSGVLALEYNNDIPETPCIRCSKCIQSCPMQLSPNVIDKNVRLNIAEKNEALSVMNCIECGICSWVCPAKRRLTQSCKTSKYLIREMIKKRG